MNPNRRVEIGVGFPHDSRRRPTRRQAGDIDATRINLVVGHHLARDTCDQGWLTRPRFWSPLLNQFQHFEELAATACSG